LGYLEKLKDEMKGFHETIGGNFVIIFCPPPPFAGANFEGKKRILGGRCCVTY